MSGPLCLDVSEYQPPLPWRQWPTVSLAIVRTSIGSRQDAAYPQHRLDAEQAGKPIALYHALWPGDGAAQAQGFWHRRFQGDEWPLLVASKWLPRFWLDVEAPDITAGLLDSFLAEWAKVSGGVVLGIYTSAAAWHGLGLPADIRYRRYPLWVADYGPVGAPYAPPSLPAPWDDWCLYQFGTKPGQHGYTALPGYSKPLDQSVINMEYVMPISDDVTHQITALLGSAHEDLDVLKAAHDAVRSKIDTVMGLLAVVPDPPPVVLHLLRNMTNQQVINLFAKAPGVGLQALDANLLAQMAAARLALYTGPALETMGLSAEQLAALVAALGA